MHVCKGFESIAVAKLNDGRALETGVAAFERSAGVANNDF
jgi:hypothetical protein